LTASRVDGRLPTMLLSVTGAPQKAAPVTKAT
jgi:hypothetical protein